MCSFTAVLHCGVVRGVTQSSGKDPAECCAERGSNELSEAVEVPPSAITDHSQYCDAQHGQMQDVITMMYQQVCEHHRSISDFRGKLLAVVPIASGAFVALISARGEWAKNGALLIPAGVVGFLVTFGLYLFEAWQSDACRHLEHHASFLENKLHVKAGQFSTLRPKTRVRDVYGRKRMRCREHCLKELERTGTPPENYPPKYKQECEPRLGVGAELAGLVVYFVVMAGWLVIAGFGVAALLNPFHPAYAV